MSARYLVVNDIHLSDRPPASCTESYLDDLFGMLEQTVELERSLGCDGTIWAGDVFHIKTPSRTSHATILRTIDIVRKYRELWIVPGNHDLMHDDLGSVGTTQPLGVLLQAGAKLLDGWADRLGPEGGRPIYGVPWQQEWSEENLKAAFQDWNSVPAKERLANSLVVTHAPLYPPGQELSFEFYPTKVMVAEVEPRAPWSMIQAVGYCAYGHVHENHGIFRVGSVDFCNHGALSRGSLSEADTTREVSATLWDSEEGFSRVPIEHKPADQVLRIAQSTEVKTHAVEVGEFLASIGSVRLGVTTAESVMAHVDTLDVAPPVRETIVRLLGEAGA